CLILLARYPQPGQVKTRLIPALGAEGAAQVYRQLAEHTVAQGRILQSQRSLALNLWYTGATEAAMQTWLGEGLIYQAQPQGDLGDRLTAAFRFAFDQGYGSAIAVGTDCPGLNAGILEQGFTALENHPLVLGPAQDGGYYLIGLKQLWPRLFQGIAWSTASVLAQTLAQARQLGLTPAFLPTLTDVDRPEDLAAWQPITWTGPTPSSRRRPPEFR
ncbi:MAG TPA: TIGR04282 family arsenosugar biosynthesis glycosyltransferase, partial [Leptolyngbyaceae cyanobacterium M65_K2018_010]|nr:TIGR04282 family arsenosugar biosynthesis glycosyltransferase [Leptolyngbyaceae cyanobacterium M65_K2018_010]